MEYKEIIGLIQEMTRTGLSRIKIEKEDFKIILEKENQEKKNIPNVVEESGNKDKQENTVQAPVPVMEEKKDEVVAGKKILSPMVGTFYAQPAPDKPPYVKVGDKVKKGQIVCIIEAMKLMNEIESEVEGEILECLVENEDMVEFGQPLFIVK